MNFHIEMGLTNLCKWLSMVVVVCSSWTAEISMCGPFCVFKHNSHWNDLTTLLPTPFDCYGDDFILWRRWNAGTCAYLIISLKASPVTAHNYILNRFFSGILHCIADTILRWHSFVFFFVHCYSLLILLVLSNWLNRVLTRAPTYCSQCVYFV